MTSHLSGQFYWELTINDFIPATSGIYLGIGNANTQSLWDDANGIAFSNNNIGWYTNGSSTGVSVTNFSVGDVMGIAVDFGAKLIWAIDWSVESPVWNASGSANPATGIGGASFSSVTGPYFAAVGCFNNGSFIGHAETVTANFGVQSYTGRSPNGFGYY
jgi:hypothetical protein